MDRESQIFLNDVPRKAFLTSDLRLLIKEHLLFRAAITFKKNRKKITLYGHEHCCTYQQVSSNFVKEIILDAKKGYLDLINYIEQKAKSGNLLSAKIYGRERPGMEFNNLHKSWYNGCWEVTNEPIISKENLCRILPHRVKDRKIEILDMKYPNFNEIISSQLK